MVAAAAAAAAAAASAAFASACFVSVSNTSCDVRMWGPPVCLGAACCWLDQHRGSCQLVGCFVE
jgi:hypothetical protein